VENQAEQGVLESVTGSTHTWVGLNDIQTEGNFLWADGSSVTYTNWKPNGQPNNGNGVQHCVQVTPTWDDVICSKIQPYVCQVTAS